MNVYGNFHEAVKNNCFWEKENTEEYKEYRRKWEQNPVDYIVGEAPIHVDIESSAICNLMCPMCNCTIERLKGENAGYKAGIMPMELYRKVIDEATEIGVCSVKLNWRGEPLMHPNIVEMVKYAREKGILEILINTNAVYLTEKMSRDLIDAGVDKLIFSVDSIQKEQYEKIRVGAKFEDTIENIRGFSKINAESGHKVQTRVQRVLLNETRDEQEAFEKFFEGIVDVVAYEDYIPYGKDPYAEMKAQGNFPEFRCPQIWQRILVTWQGKCFMCCNSMTEDYQIGDINTEHLRDIWIGKRLQAVRKLQKEGKWYMFPKCRDCFFPYMKCEK